MCLEGIVIRGCVDLPHNMSDPGQSLGLGDVGDVNVGANLVSLYPLRERILNVHYLQRRFDVPRLSLGAYRDFGHVLLGDFLLSLLFGRLGLLGIPLQSTGPNRGLLEICILLEPT